MKEIDVSKLDEAKIRPVGLISDWTAKIIFDDAYYYTTDGSAPSKDSKQYDGCLIVGGSDILPDTGIVPVRYSIEKNGSLTEGAPIICLFDRSVALEVSLPFGSYDEPQEIELLSKGDIFYTLDGSAVLNIYGEPSNRAIKYTGPIEVSDTVVNAVAILNGHYSNLLQGEYKIVKEALELRASHESGDYSNPIAVRLTTNIQDGVAIRYTLDGVDPSLGAIAYDSAIILGNTPGPVTLRAVAMCDTAYSNSIIKKYNFKE